MQHRGEIVEKVVRESGIPLAEVARRLKKSRRHIYNMFENPHLSLDEILQIRKIIHYDFGKYFTELRNHRDLIREPKPEYGESATYWKNKYITLLEKYNVLLERVSGKN